MKLNSLERIGLGLIIICTLQSHSHAFCPDGTISFNNVCYSIKMDGCPQYNLLINDQCCLESCVRGGCVGGDCSKCCTPRLPNSSNSNNINCNQKSGQNQCASSCCCCTNNNCPIQTCTGQTRQCQNTNVCTNCATGSGVPSTQCNNLQITLCGTNPPINCNNCNCPQLQPCCGQSSSCSDTNQQISEGCNNPPTNCNTNNCQNLPCSGCSNAGTVVGTPCNPCNNQQISGGVTNPPLNCNNNSCQNQPCSPCSNNGAGVGTPCNPCNNQQNSGGVTNPPLNCNNNSCQNQPCSPCSNNGTGVGTPCNPCNNQQNSGGVTNPPLNCNNNSCQNQPCSACSNNGTGVGTSCNPCNNQQNSGGVTNPPLDCAQTGRCSDNASGCGTPCNPCNNQPCAQPKPPPTEPPTTVTQPPTTIPPPITPPPTLPPTTTSPPENIVQCPPGTILMNGHCRLLYCPLGTVMSEHNTCIQIVCPAGTVWNGNKCAPQEPIVQNITLYNNVITYSNDSRPDIILNTSNNFSINAPITINESQDNFNDCNDESCDQPSSTPPSQPTKCCDVMTPRTCELRNNRWYCYSRRYKRCDDDFCTAPTIYLKAPRIHSRPNHLIMPPQPQHFGCGPSYGNCGQRFRGSYDCSGCGSGIMQHCAPYCYHYSCPSQSCMFYDQQMYCMNYPGSEGCMPHDGCYDEWCSAI